jgi:hypothetical protein
LTDLGDVLLLTQQTPGNDIFEAIYEMGPWPLL